MAQARILLIGYKKNRSDTFIPALQKRYHLFIVPSGKKGLELAGEVFPQVVIIDATAMRTAGERLCRKVSEALPHTPLIYIHPSPDQDLICEADVLLIPPFTSRKLTNAIERLLQASDDEVITCGPFSMNLVRRTLLAYGSETQLTPKQAQLVETFLRNPGIVIDRKQLMEAVWETDYMGDTRTLDVHIRWIRQAMEEGGKPRYLKTVRGVGYKLDIPNLNGSR